MRCLNSNVPLRDASQCRLSLRERTSFRGAKGVKQARPVIARGYLASVIAAYIILNALAVVGGADEPSADAPRAADPRLEVVCFARSPDIRHPISLDFDGQGRLLVIESHTHFRPQQYDGPKHDRIRVIEDTDGDGRADRYSTFFEGTDFTMDLAVHPDGSVYVATRDRILRLDDRNRDGVADGSFEIVRLETKSQYPHNGLSGLAFDYYGNLVFGMGENEGAKYQLSGTEVETFEDEGEGGNIFTCWPYGHRLRRIATGFWNPFGVTIDIFGRIWAVDNDPDAMPPCRLLHIVGGGDYGYQYRYGRSGRHPFQAWNGQLPGTLPMASGTGEAPCEVVSYESDGLPEEYLGNLLVTSWADHRVERYKVAPRGASYSAERQPFVQGGSEFRPVGLAIAPDGSLFISDWVRSDYNLHNQGVIWQVRPRAESRVGQARGHPLGRERRPTDSAEALLCRDRRTREAAARRLVAKGDTSISVLRDRLHNDDVRVRATAVAALAGVSAAADDLRKLADNDLDAALRALAVSAFVAHEGPGRWLNADQPPAVRLAAVGGLRWQAAVPRLLELLDNDDAFIRSAAVRQLARVPDGRSEIPSKLSPRARIGLLLAQRAAGEEDADVVDHWLDDPDEDVRFLAVKWIADRKLADMRPRLVEALQDGDLNVRMYQSYATALGRIDGEEVGEAKMAEHWVAVVADEHVSAARRVAALRLVPANYERLTIDLLRRLVADPNPALQLEAVRALAEHPKPERFALLEEIVRDTSRSGQLRAEALVATAERTPVPTEVFMELATGDDPALREEAIRAMTGESLDEQKRNRLLDLTGQHPDVTDLVQRVVGGPPGTRPPHDDLAAWLERLNGSADAPTGRRVFFHPKLTGCYRCHRVDGRGREVGPDLSVIGRTERRHLLESILQPSNLVPPHYQVWQLELHDGRSLTGMLLRTHLDEYSYVDPQGNQFKVRTTDIAESHAASQSIMPVGMADRLTDQELRDLLAYLGEHR
jgi:putative membrane-bound dehydrogenase-like protein